MFTRYRFFAASLMVMVTSFSAIGLVFAQTSDGFKLYDTHVHFVSEDQANYPMRTDAAANPYEADMRQYARSHPTYAKRILGLWDANGVEGGVAVQYRTAYDTDNRYVLDSAATYPKRVTAVVIVDASDPSTPQALRKIVTQQHASAIRLTGSQDKATGQFPWLDSPSALETWKVANELGIAVVLMPGPVYQVNPAAMEHIAKLAAEFPNTDIVLDHFVWPAPEGAPSYGLTPGHLALKNYKNIYYKFTTLNSLSLEKAHVPSEDFLKFAVATYGADHVMWGSDTGNNKLEYSELVERGRLAAAKLTPEERRKVYYDTGKSVFIAGGRGRL